MFSRNDIDRFASRLVAALVVAATVVLALLANAAANVQVVA